MDDRDIFTTTEEERAARHARRIAARKAREKARRIALLKRAAPVLAVMVAALGGLVWWISSDGGNRAEADREEHEISAPAVMQVPEKPQEETEPEKPKLFAPVATGQTVALGEDIVSQYAILMDAETGEVLAGKASDTVMSPASMTKVLTVLTASQALKSPEALKDTVTIDLTITDYCFTNGCSVVGFELDEKVPVLDLFYGTVMPSGADAALALATYVAGSHEAFVEMMNEKAAELGVSDTAHFTNCVGVYNEANVCTVEDMAVILRAALEDPLCREVLSTKIYKTQETEKHPEGQDLSNWFIRRIEDKDSGSAKVLGGKTGYVHESGSCAASFAESAEGKRYICVTGDATSKWTCIYDHAALYKTYIG